MTPPLKEPNSWWWVAPILWPMLGGAWGAWLGFRGYFRVALNADSFAPLFVIGMYALFAVAGLVAGAATCALVGLPVDRLLRRLGVGMVAALCVASALNVLALWQVGEFVQSRYPGLRGKSAAVEFHAGAKHGHRILHAGLQGGVGSA